MKLCGCGTPIWDTTRPKTFCDDCNRRRKQDRDRKCGSEDEGVARPATFLACLDLDLICDCDAVYKRRQFFERASLTCSCGRVLSWRCPFVSCRHHLYGDVKAEQYRAPRDPEFELGPLAFPETCCLDILNRDHTLEEIGQLFDLTRERVRQVEVAARRKLVTRLKALDITPEPVRGQLPNYDLFAPRPAALSLRHVTTPYPEPVSNQYADHVRAWRVATIVPAHYKPKPHRPQKRFVVDPWLRRRK